VAVILGFENRLTGWAETEVAFGSDVSFTSEGATIALQPAKAPPCF